MPASSLDGAGARAVGNPTSIPGPHTPGFSLRPRPALRVLTVPVLPRIAEAAAYGSCPLSAASYLISLEVVPPPTLSQNLSGSPLTTIRLRHKLVSWGASALVSDL